MGTDVGRPRRRLVKWFLVSSLLDSGGRSIWRFGDVTVDDVVSSLIASTKYLFGSCERFRRGEGDRETPMEKSMMLVKMKITYKSL